MQDFCRGLCRSTPTASGFLRRLRRNSADSGEFLQKVMDIRELLQTLLVWGLYPVWLLAGAGDYLCHRQTDIEHTSGTKESWLHLLQFVSLLLAFAAAALMNLNAVVFGVMIALVISHSVLAHIDVSYTDGRRHISPVEQLVHGFMDVLPLVAVALVGVLHWSEITAPLNSPIFSPRPLELGRALLVGSFAVLSGVPILEELARTYRHRGERHFQAGLATIK
jgi:hypothetical protein